VEEKEEKGRRERRNVALASAICLSASTALLAVAILAKSAAGPTMENSLEPSYTRLVA
jgi:hypothetical protein